MEIKGVAGLSDGRLVRGEVWSIPDCCSVSRNKQIYGIGVFPDLLNSKSQIDGHSPAAMHQLLCNWDSLP
jgi:hypothetical protein